jgi:hypothetical protein
MRRCPRRVLDAGRSRACAAVAAAPDTTITSGPANGLWTADATPTYGFSANQSPVSFHRQIDDGTWQSVSSPNTLGALTDGSHTVRYRATNAYGEVDPTPATRVVVIDTANLAYKHPATASSSDSTSVRPTLAVDGDRATRWASRRRASGSQWWQVDLGTAKDVGRITVAWTSAYASRYDIRTSVDGSSWSTAATASATGAGDIMTSFAARSARYVRVVALSAVASTVSFTEARVYAPAATVAPAPTAPATEPAPTQPARRRRNPLRRPRPRHAHAHAQ